MTDVLPADAIERALALRPDRRAHLLRHAPPAIASQIIRAQQAQLDPLGHQLYRTLGYEPICKPRVRAAQALGYATPMEAIEAGDEAQLPEPCGTCPQELFDAATEFDVFYGGAAGGGKTLGMLMIFVRHSALNGARCLFLRETYDELDENVFPELRKIDYAREIGARWNSGRKELTFPSNGAVRFRYLANLEDIGRRQGGSYQAIGLDERTQLPPGTADGLKDRLRSAGGVPVLGIRSTGNPGGRAHGEMKDQYVTPTDHGARTIMVPSADPSGQPSSLRFIPAKATDNPYLDDSYFTVTLAGIKDPARRRAMRDGDWDVFAGQFFSEWRHTRHVVPRTATTIQPTWPRTAGIDYGYAAPWCVLWDARDNDGRLWFYREVYLTGIGEKDQARMVKEAEGAAREYGVKRFADPSMWSKAGDAQPIADTYAAAGVRLNPANNDRLNGWARVHTYLADGPACQYHRELDGWQPNLAPADKTCPMIHVLEGTCPNLERTIGSVPFDRHKVEDLDSDSEDHAVDALRYNVMSHRNIRRRPLTGAQQRAAHAESM